MREVRSSRLMSAGLRLKGGPTQPPRRPSFLLEAGPASTSGNCRLSHCLSCRRQHSPRSCPAGWRSKGPAAGYISAGPVGPEDSGALAHAAG
jgi:hypothetical protein